MSEFKNKLNFKDNIELLKTNLNELTDILKILNGLKIKYAKEIRKHDLKHKESFNNNFKISDHAIIQYFERELGFNIDEIRKKLTNDKIKYIYDNLQCTTDINIPIKIQLSNKTSVVIKNNTILTVLYNNEKDY